MGVESFHADWTDGHDEAFRKFANAPKTPSLQISEVRQYADNDVTEVLRSK